MRTRCPAPTSRAGLLGDLHVYDPVPMAWTDLSAAASGTPPCARLGHGFTAAGGLLFVHGGLGHQGNFSTKRAGMFTIFK